MHLAATSGSGTSLSLRRMEDDLEMLHLQQAERKYQQLLDQTQSNNKEEEEEEAKPSTNTATVIKLSVEEVMRSLDEHASSDEVKMHIDPHEEGGRESRGGEEGGTSGSSSSEEGEPEEHSSSEQSDSSNEEVRGRKPPVVASSKTQKADAMKAKEQLHKMRK